MAQYTKKAILQTFQEMLEKMPFDKITVSAIVSNCEISSNTFYYHYQDIYDLLDVWLSIKKEKYIERASVEAQWQDTVKAMLWEMEKSGLKNIIQDRTFEKFQAVEPWQKRLKEGTQEYARDLPGWLLLCGQSGSGKTHLATAVCRQRLLQGDEVRYMPWRDKIGEIKSMSLDVPRRLELIQGYKQAQVLYIDDLYKTGRTADGSAMPSQADLNLAFELINHRYINRLVTIVSTERSPQELVSLDEATGSRIIEMAGEHVYAIAPDMKKNYRLRKIVTL